MENKSSYSASNEMLYLIGFHRNLDSKEIDLYTLMTFGGDENQPIMVDGCILFFDEPELASAALELVNTHMKRFGPPPDEIAAIYDISEMLQLIQTEDIDETATIVDCLNVFDDLLKAIKQPLPPDYKRMLYAVADHLTFHREFGTFLAEHQIDRVELRKAVEWCLETIFSRSKLLSLQSWTKAALRNTVKPKRKTGTRKRTRTSEKQEVAAAH